MTKGKTHHEDGKYYAVIRVPGGYEYYSGAFKSHAAAYQCSVRETQRHAFAGKNGLIYNARGL